MRLDILGNRDNQLQKELALLPRTSRKCFVMLTTVTQLVSNGLNNIKSTPVIEICMITYSNNY